MPAIENTMLVLTLSGLLAYLLGAVPFGLVMARLFGLGDLRQIGSGNIGTTNVLRTGNRLAAFLTLVLDAGKGGIAVLVARATLGEDAAQIAAFTAFLGHCFPIYLGFRGGKGVATFLGTLVVLAWPVGLGACATWLVIALITRYSSMSALVAAALCPLWMILSQNGQMLILGGLLTLLIYIRHWPNLLRLKAGTEPRIGQKR